MTIPSATGEVRRFLKGNSNILLENGSAILRNAGNGVALLSMQTKMNTIDGSVFDILARIPDLPDMGMKALVIASDVPKVFSAGAQLDVFIDFLRSRDYSGFDAFVRRGQKAMIGLATAPFPVLSAVAGLALGGGCELMLNCDRVVFSETKLGFPERKVGIIPGWTGTSHLMARASQRIGDPADAAKTTFDIIMAAQAAVGSEEARARGLLLPDDIEAPGSTLLETAVDLAVRLSATYVDQALPKVRLPGTGSEQELLNSFLDGFQEADLPQIAPIAKELAAALCGEYEKAISFEEMLEREAGAVSRLCRRPETLQLMERVRG